MSFIGTFNPSDVTLAINDYIVTDFAEGSFLEIIQNTKNFRQVAGIRGKHTRVHTRDRSGTIIVRLMQTSQDNEILSKLAYQDDVNQTGLLNVYIKDNSGQSGFQLVNAYIDGTPNVTYQSGETVPREWRIYYEALARYDVSGNKNPPLDILSGLS